MLKIITLNCQRAYQEKFIDFFAKLLNSSEYDFILLQEANEKVHKVIKENSAHYDLIFTHNIHTNSHHEICLIYRKEFEIVKTKFLNFYDPAKKMLTQSGCAIGLFRLTQKFKKDFSKEYALIGSLHLQASYHARIRKRELIEIKSAFDELGEGYSTIQVLGGDFNNLGPWEKYLNHLRLLPNLKYASTFREYTHNSAYLEKIHLDKKLAKFFLVDKLKYKVKLDHYYIDTESHKSYTFKSQTLKIDISDHRPVVMEIS